MPVRKETDLYAPVKGFWEARGYEVRGEVGHCDLVALRGEEEPVIVELKKTLNLPLLVQGLDRRRQSSQVYLAVETGKNGRAPHGLKWSELTRLCRMLGLGLLTVRFYSRKKPFVELLCEPEGACRQGERSPAANAAAASANPEAVESASPDADSTGQEPVVPTAFSASLKPMKHRTARLVSEFRERSGDYNVGGSTKTKLVTAYRERALECAEWLHRKGPLSPKQLRELTGSSKVSLMLRRNVYRWFERVERGVYRLTPHGEDALQQFAHVLEAKRTPSP
ncbi:DUF2161 family putative PD-(D/E)XK-type phosphodiesterase [Paenibacillus sp. y28]|uniref:DUF2161 family putative PD-(D/E)XK-type phosphodiesterase n=1 Tax=Paenibacillus sp. y28 TaxID=3129110 RepID=UPI0030190016